MLADTPEHRGTWEAFQIVSQQLEAAEAAQEDALLIAELEDELYILYTKLSQAAPRFSSSSDTTSYRGISSRAQDHMLLIEAAAAKCPSAFTGMLCYSCTLGYIGMGYQEEAHFATQSALLARLLRLYIA